LGHESGKEVIGEGVGLREISGDTREAWRKVMNTTTRGHSVWVMVVMALLAVLFVLAVAVAFAQLPAPTGSSIPQNPGYESYVKW
jgi:signal transduction histidine kinase